VSLPRAAVAQAAPAAVDAAPRVRDLAADAAR
jgi:hypothetical protein